MVAAPPRSLNFAFAVVVLVLALDGSICFISLHRLIVNQRLVLDSETFLQQINDTLSLVKDAETGQRGYLLSGEEQFLEPYHAALRDLQVRLPGLEQEAGDGLHERRDLIANALKFTAPGESPVVVITAETADEFVRRSIRDYGIGIEPDFFERIFQVFERLHGQDQFPGTGIGLAIVKKGVERMGGTCGVESEMSRGSNFWIRLRRVPGVT